MSQPDRRPTPPLATLRPCTAADAALLRQWRLEPSVGRYQPLHDVPLSQLRSELAAQRTEELYRGRGEKFQWIVLADGEPVGWITLMVTNWDHGLAEVGYALSSEHQRRGLMPQALGHLLAELFFRTKIHRLEARCSVDNVASQRVLEKLGFEREGRLREYFELRGDRVDNYLYALLRGDYLGR